MASCTPGCCTRTADLVGGLILAIVFRRSMSLLWHTHNLPGKLAALLDPDGRADALSWIKEVDGAWREAETKASNWWVVARRHSPFSYLVVVKALVRRVSVMGLRRCSQAPASRAQGVSDSPYFVDERPRSARGRLALLSEALWRHHSAIPKSALDLSGGKGPIVGNSRRP